jgi:hypothetical protein
MSRDDIGDRGQWLFCLLMTDLCGRDAPFFRPRFLGDKFPTFDYLVELVDHPAFFFFVQVKTTTQGYTKDPIRLKVQVSTEDVNRMVSCPAPTYVAGIDSESGSGYLLSVNEEREHVASLVTLFPLNCGNLQVLRDEVVGYWSSRNMVLTGSRFNETR